jgi:hypothetical protein
MNDRMINGEGNPILMSFVGVCHATPIQLPIPRRGRLIAPIARVFRKKLDRLLVIKWSEC